MPYPERKTTPLRERIKGKFSVSDTGCWLWTASLTKAGYGLIGVGRRGEGLVYAHRAMYELTYGVIPEHMELDHKCRVPRCVNPAHLEAVTHKENMLRGIAPCAINAKKTHCLRGHVLPLRPNTTHGRRCMVCVRMLRKLRGD